MLLITFHTNVNFFHGHICVSNGLVQTHKLGTPHMGVYISDTVKQLSMKTQLPFQQNIISYVAKTVTSQTSLLGDRA